MMEVRVTMPRSLPHPPTLRDAVNEVIVSNRRDGYPPQRFIEATQHGEALDLNHVCEHLILSPGTLSWLTDALMKHGQLLFLGDLVAEYVYGLSSEAVKEAKRRVDAFDQLVGMKRWHRSGTD
jgi:hypothetical protein